MRIVLTPRWGGSADSDFYPWLRAQLDAAGRDVEVVAAPLLPSPDAPAIEPTVAAVLALLEVAPADTVAIGHSVGCQATLRALARLDARVAGCLLVAPWLDVDERWPEIEPWCTEPIAVDGDAAVRRAVGRLQALISTDDPFTADYAATRDALARRFRAGVRVIEGGAHFNRAEEPEVLRALRSLID